MRLLLTQNVAFSGPINGDGSGVGKITQQAPHLNFGELWEIQRFTSSVVAVHTGVGFSNYDMGVSLNGTSLSYQVLNPPSAVSSAVFNFAPNGPVIYRPGDQLVLTNNLYESPNWGALINAIWTFNGTRVAP